MRFCCSFMFMAALCIGLGGNGFTPAQAAPVIFFGEDLNLSGKLRVPEFPNSISAQTDFLSHLERSKIEDFEGFEDKNRDILIDFGEAGIATLAGGYVSGDWDISAINNGRFSTSDSGDHFFEVRADAGTAFFTLEFETAQSAFGFFGLDFEWSRTTLTIETPGGEITGLDIPFTMPSPSGSALFFGVIDTENPFTKITFEGVNIQNDWFGFDDFTIGVKDQVINPAPEPDTMVLLGCGLIFLGACTRKLKST